MQREIVRNKVPSLA